MLSSHDDYPIHQTPDPVSTPAITDKNFYDRYWFNGYDEQGGFYFAIAMGLYPNRRVMDASLSIVKDDVQHSFHGSRLAPDDPSENRVGPLRIEVVEPMRVLRVVLEPNESGVEAELLFEPRTACVEEARAPMKRDRRTVMDTTRFTQFGRWSGHVAAHGERTEVRPETTRGTRDRSWGIRPVGEAEGGRPTGEPQIFFLWAPLHFGDFCTHAATFETPDGVPWDNHARILPAYDTPEKIPGIEDPGVKHFLGVSHEIRWQPGTRWASSASLTFQGTDGAGPVIELEPILRFQMLGLGYVNPDWGHGHWKGDLLVGGETWRPSELDPLDFRYRHVQQVVKARYEGHEGVGVLEQIVFGPYERYGFEG